MGERKICSSYLDNAVMISEKTFIRYYSSFWEQLLPGVDHYIRMINSGFKERLFTPINIEDISTRRALINNIAFRLFHKITTQSMSLNDLNQLSSESENLKLLKVEISQQMAFLNNAQNFNLNLNANEIQIIKILTKRLCEFSESKSNLEVYPKFQGCGLLFNCFGDIKYDNTLVEIKAGEGSFSRQDIYQLITYGALNYISDDAFHFEKFQLVNVRTGVVWTEEIETICEITGGASSAEIYSEVVNYISNNYRSI
nr:hypothetical protein [uncultured Fluviicola sp.]